MTYPAHRSMYDRFDDPELLADEQAMQVDELDVEYVDDSAYPTTA